MLTPDQYAELIHSPWLDDELASDDPLRLILIEGSEPGHALPDPGSIPVVIAALGPESAAPVAPTGVDLTVDADDAELLTRSVDTTPLAAVSLAVLLRGSEHAPVDAALALESSVYSMLQGGAEFANWRGDVAPERITSDDPTVVMDRVGDVLYVTLDRPQRHNAITAQLRDELCAALSLALADDTIDRVVFTGNGPSFCSGGDLAEFGARPDPAQAHLTRLTRSPARLLHRLADRAHVQIHGHTLGGGIEMAAFAGHVTAHPDTEIGLPEIGLGLIPGAGGTVSLPRRIGRHRTAWLALTGRTIDAATALDWGVVDAVGNGLAGPVTSP